MKLVEWFSSENQYFGRKRKLLFKVIFIPDSMAILRSLISYSCSWKCRSSSLFLAESFIFINSKFWYHRQNKIWIIWIGNNFQRMQRIIIDLWLKLSTRFEFSFYKFLLNNFNNIEPIWLILGFVSFYLDISNHFT